MTKHSHKNRGRNTARRGSGTNPRNPKAGSPRATSGEQTKGKARDKRVWLFGHHPVIAALNNPNRWFHRVLATRQGLARLEEAGNQIDAPVEEADSDAIMVHLPEGAVHQGLAVLCDPLDTVHVEDITRPSTTDAESAEKAESGPILILDQVTDPHNVGAILRSGAIFGAAGVIIQDRNAPPESGTLAKSASGALESVPLVRAGNLAQVIAIVQEAGYWVVGLAGEAQETLPDAGLKRRTAIVLGAEGSGLRRLTAERCDQLLRIPMAPNQVGSLNVSNAAAIALYELSRG